MKSKKKRATKRQDEFPGYPKYPASDDIMNRNERVSLDSEVPIEGAEGLELQNTLPPENINQTPNPPRQPDPLDPEKDTKSDDLKDRIYPVDFSGKDLDVPGAELDDESEETGSEDEENNLYSRGNDD
jgi:hypothetical protein